MTNSGYLFWIISVVIFSFLYLFSEKFTNKIFGIKEYKVSYENANAALNKIESWSKWLTGLQTAGIASLALLIKDYSKYDKIINLSNTQKIVCFFVLLFFGSSIILSSWLLGSIPSIQQRLKDSTTPILENDIYTKTIFGNVPFTLGRFSELTHAYFLIGIIFFTLFIFSLFK